MDQEKTLLIEEYKDLILIISEHILEIELIKFNEKRDF